MKTPPISPKQSISPLNQGASSSFKRGDQTIQEIAKHSFTECKESPKKESGMQNTFATLEVDKQAFYQQINYKAFHKAAMQYNYSLMNDKQQKSDFKLYGDEIQRFKNIAEVIFKENKGKQNRFVLNLELIQSINMCQKWLNASFELLKEKDIINMTLHSAYFEINDLKEKVIASVKPTLIFWLNYPHQVETSHQWHDEFTAKHPIFGNFVVNCGLHNEEFNENGQYSLRQLFEGRVTLMGEKILLTNEEADSLRKIYRYHFQLSKEKPTSSFIFPPSKKQGVDDN